jgi:hypothetical protein
MYHKNNQERRNADWQMIVEMIDASMALSIKKKVLIL